MGPCLNLQIKTYRHCLLICQDCQWIQRHCRIHPGIKRQKSSIMPLRVPQANLNIHGSSFVGVSTRPSRSWPENALTALDMTVSMTFNNFEFPNSKHVRVSISYFVNMIRAASFLFQVWPWKLVFWSDHTDIFYENVGLQGVSHCLGNDNISPCWIWIQND